MSNYAAVYDVDGNSIDVDGSLRDAANAGTERETLHFHPYSVPTPPPAAAASFLRAN